MEASLIRVLPDILLDFRHSEEATRSVPSALPAQPPLSPRRSRWWASGAFEECLLRPRVALGVLRGRRPQVCHTGQLAWLCLRPWTLSPSPFRIVLLRSSRSLFSCLHLRFQEQPLAWTRIRDTSRQEVSLSPCASQHTSSSSCRLGLDFVQDPSLGGSDENLIQLLGWDDVCFSADSL